MNMLKIFNGHIEMATANCPRSLGERTEKATVITKEQNVGCEI
jgi:hypothetical protein